MRPKWHNITMFSQFESKEENCFDSTKKFVPAVQSCLFHFLSAAPFLHTDAGSHHRVLLLFCMNTILMWYMHLQTSFVVKLAFFFLKCKKNDATLATVVCLLLYYFTFPFNYTCLCLLSHPCCRYWSTHTYHQRYSSFTFNTLDGLFVFSLALRTWCYFFPSSIAGLS